MSKKLISLLILVLVAATGCQIQLPTARPTAVPTTDAEAIAAAVVAQMPEQPSADEIADAVASGVAVGLKTAQAVQPETASVAPTATPTAAMSAAATGAGPEIKTQVVQPALPAPYVSEGGVPYNGSTIAFDLRPNEVEVYTAGPVTAVGIALPGGESRGSVVVMLPDPAGHAMVRYDLTGVLPGSGWHGGYQFDRYPTEAEWRLLAENSAGNLMDPPNCSDGLGCDLVDIIVIKPGPAKVAQWVVQKIAPAEPAAAAPTATAEVAAAAPTPTPQAPPAQEHQDFSFAAGEEKDVATGYNISGDVEYWDGASWVPTYDGSTRGNILVVGKPVRVKAQWGASATASRSVEELEAELLASGCGLADGCPSVVVHYWPPR